MRTIKFTAAAAIAAVAMYAATGNRQVTSNAKSPSAETSMMVNGKNVTIEYNAPSAHDRKVEGGLIPYDGIYRFGADAATTLTTDTDLMIGDLHVPKGVYTLYLQANEKGPWLLAVNRQTKQWGTVYNKDQDLGRTMMKVTKLDSKVDKFNLTLANGMLTMEWGNTKATVPVKGM